MKLMVAKTAVYWNGTRKAVGAVWTRPTGESDRVRHGVQFSAGNQDFVLDDAVDVNCKDASPDTHGQRNVRGVLKNFTTDGKAKIGNVSYPAGDQEIIVENGTCDLKFEIQGGSGQIRMTNVSAKFLQQTCIRNYPQFYPHDCEYLSCTFTNTDNSGSNHCFECAMDNGNGSGTLIRRFTNQVFKWCTFVQEETDDPSWCMYMGGLTDDSDASFENCAFIQYDDRELIKNEAQVSSSELVLAYDTCTFDSIENRRYAFLFEVDSFGQCSIANSTFITDVGPSPPPAFADNKSASFNVLEAGNTIHSH